MGRPSNTLQRKQEIAAALLRVMAQVGYEKASIQAIAKEANLTSGLIHYHFQTKQEILISAVDWVASKAEERLTLLQEEKQSPWHKLEAFINARLATGASQMPEMVTAWVVIAAESIRHPEIKLIYQRLIATQINILSSLLLNVWEEKTMIDNEVSNLSAIVIATIEGAFQLSITASDVMPKDYAASSVIQLIQNRVSN